LGAETYLFSSLDSHADAVPRPYYLSTKMAQEVDNGVYAPKHSALAAGTVSGVGHESGGSYTVTLDENPSVEQVQTYTTKPQTPTSYVLY